MEYKIVYSKRKTVGLHIKDGELTVRAPYGVDLSFIEKLVSSKAGWIEKNIKKQSLRKSVPDLSDDEIKRLKKEAKRYFASVCGLYAKIMNLSYNRITVTGAKTRFGSCSSKKNISFSYRLMLYPESAREYVVVHELAHLVELNHSKRFYGIIEKYMPDYKERQKLLKNR